MNRTLRGIILTALGTVVLAAGVGALAWACTPESRIMLDPSSGPAGSTITVTGEGFIPGAVQISWNGTPVASATGPSFSVPVTVPAVAPGVYYIVATATRADGSVAGEARRAFRVGSPAPPSAGPVPDGTSQPAVTAPKTKAAPKKQRSRSESPSRQGTSGSGKTPAADTGASAPAAAAPATKSGSGAPTRSVRRDRAARPGAAPRPRAAPSPRSASSDLWSGFRTTGGDTALPGAGGPSSGPGSSLIPSLALLGLGAVSLLWAVGIAAAGRAARRTP